MKVTVNNEALAALLSVKPGDKVEVPCKNGIPTNREWRNRFKDAKIDECITIVQNTPKPKKEPK